jgi:hypothetical protein
MSCRACAPRYEQQRHAGYSVAVISGLMFGIKLIFGHTSCDVLRLFNCSAAQYRVDSAGTFADLLALLYSGSL